MWLDQWDYYNEARTMGLLQWDYNNGARTISLLEWDLNHWTYLSDRLLRVFLSKSYKSA